MKRNRLVMIAAAALWSGASFAGTEGTSSTFYGMGAGVVANPNAGANTFVGVNAGNAVTTGIENTLVGKDAGSSVTTGAGNTVVGIGAAMNLTVGGVNTIIGPLAGGAGLQNGVRNVFIGYGAGYSEAGSHRLYIDNCMTGALCQKPLIYGEFDNHRLHFDGIVGVTANRVASAVKSQLHFSVTGADEGGWLTSAAANNFFTSSGARYDADAGGWIQRSADGKAVIAGSGAAGFRVLTSSGTAVGAVASPVSRLHIDYAGLLGVNTAPVAGRAINTSTGAYLSTGGVWTNASSRALKEDIERLTADEAQQAFVKLDPVRFRYKDETGTHVGFIAEDVPELVATEDRKGLSSMDVVAVLTKVVQRQDAELDELKAQVRALTAEVQRLR